jgi:hypothetical protein
MAKTKKIVPHANATYLINGILQDTSRVVVELVAINTDKNVLLILRDRYREIIEIMKLKLKNRTETSSSKYPTLL